MSPTNEDEESVGENPSADRPQSGNGTTLRQFIAEQTHRGSQSPGSFSRLLRDIGRAAKNVAHRLRVAGLNDISGSTGKTNVQGEVQQKMDVVAHREFEQALRRRGDCCLLGSEEHAEVLSLTQRVEAPGPYVVLLDPLDGSSNIDVGVSVGTIFGIYRLPDGRDREGAEEDAVLRAGRQQIGAGYVLYGSSTLLVYTTGDGVNGFTLDPAHGQFFLSHPSLTIPETGRVFSVNVGYFHAFRDRFRDYLNRVLEKEQPARTWYIGSFVSDFHRNLLKGGIYIYPVTKSEPNGKLRLMYEANPMAFLAEQAGGRATDGENRILDKTPEDVHERTPLFVGSEKMVRRAEAFLREEPPG